VEKRVDSIDLVKGCAILWVFLIHSQALGDTRLFRNVVNQAVPIFVVLFGVNSELWWRRYGVLGEWYAGRFRRIVVPMWTALPVWWAFALYWRPLTLTLTRTLPLWQLAGYLAEVGTGWFITMILQFVLVFPLLHAAARRWGPWPLLFVGMAVTVVCAAYQFRLMAALRGFGPLPAGEVRQEFLNFYVFAPRFLAQVALGIAVAPLVRGFGIRAGVFALVAYAACIFLARGGSVAWVPAAASTLMALPLTILLLAAFNMAPRVPVATPALAWLGRSSYGLYLGQLLVHNAFVFALGIALYGTLNLWLYTLELLVGALFFVALGGAALRLVEALRKGGFPLPSLAR
jgi:peptidoglycan/LPS O-acetylase OafA/YrhL